MPKHRNHISHNKCSTIEVCRPIHVTGTVRERQSARIHFQFFNDNMTSSSSHRMRN